MLSIGTDLLDRFVEKPPSGKYVSLIFESDSGQILEKRTIDSIWIVSTLAFVLVIWLFVLVKTSYDLKELRSRDAERAADLAATYAEQVRQTVKSIDQIALTVKYQWQDGRMPMDLRDQYEKAMHHTPTYPGTIGIDGKVISSWWHAAVGLDFGAVDFFPITGHPMIRSFA